MSDYLPLELWSAIFSKLPIKLVIQCTAVCKKWHSIITSSTFISSHLSLSRQNPLLLTRTRNPYRLTLHFDTDQPLRLFQTLRCPFPVNRNLRVVGCVDGLVLVSDDIHGKPYDMMLWNPLIRKSILLPEPRFYLPSEVSIFGFGVDSTGDYKVVRFVYLLVSDDYQLPPLVEVYSLRNRMWRTVVSTCVDYLVYYFDKTSCFIHNAIHWIGCKKSHVEKVILLFDLEIEDFKMMSLPEPKKCTCFSSISVLGGLLCVYGSCKSATSVWVKTDYYADSWTKLVTNFDDNPKVGQWENSNRNGWEVL